MSCTAIQVARLQYKYATLLLILHPKYNRYGKPSLGFPICSLVAVLLRPRSEHRRDGGSHGSSKMMEAYEEGRTDLVTNCDLIITRQ